MDINAWRIAFTLISFVIFLGIVAWALSRRNRQAFESSALQNPCKNASNPRLSEYLWW